MLLFNKKLTAVQACDQGLVTEVFPDASFQTEVWTRLKAYAQLPPNVWTHTADTDITEPLSILTLLGCCLSISLREKSSRHHSAPKLGILVISIYRYCEY